MGEFLRLIASYLGISYGTDQFNAGFLDKFKL